MVKVTGGKIVLWGSYRPPCDTLWLIFRRYLVTGNRIISDAEIFRAEGRRGKVEVGAGKVTMA